MCPKTVFLGDGVPGIGELQRVDFPHGIQILDIFHAIEHLDKLCESLFPASSVKETTIRWFEMLKYNQVADVFTQAQEQLHALAPEADTDEKLQTQIDYFEKNKTRMLYKTDRQG
jgi:hypothetical protein